MFGHSQSTARSLFVLICVALSACSDASPTRPNTTVEGVKGVVEISRPRTLDDEYESLVDSIPGFGGWYIDTEGYPTVVLIDTTLRPVAEQRLSSRVGEARRSNRGGRQEVALSMRVRAGSYDFRQLRRWAKAAERILDVERDAVFVDANEGSNRVEIGVSSSAAALRVASAMAEQGVPEGAYEILVVPRTKTMIDVTGRFRPVPGGVQVQHSGGFCTLAFNVSLSYSGPIGVMTNAHCTPVYGSVTSGAEYWQHAFASNKIGVEYLDPSPWQNTPECMIWRYPYNMNGVCRYADAAVVDYSSTSADSVEFGYIARTMSRAPLNTGPGSKTINPANKHFEIASKKYSITQGLYVDRLGINSGWTYHNVSHTCTVQYGDGSGGKKAKLWCQYRTAGGSTASSGDSGGPIWTYDYCDNGQLTRPDGTACISLAGIFWGGAGDRLIFSSIQDIEADFGITFGVRPADKP